MNFEKTNLVRIWKTIGVKPEDHHYCNGEVGIYNAEENQEGDIKLYCPTCQRIIFHPFELPESYNKIIKEVKEMKWK